MYLTLKVIVVATTCFWLTRILVQHLANTIALTPLTAIIILHTVGGPLPSIQSVVSITVVVFVYFATRRTDVTNRWKEINFQVWHLGSIALMALISAVIRFPVYLSGLNVVPQATDSVLHGYVVASIRDNGVPVSGAGVRIDPLLGGSVPYPFGAHVLPGAVADGGILGVSQGMNLVLFILCFMGIPFLVGLIGFALSRSMVVSLLAALGTGLLPSATEVGFHLYAYAVGLYAFLALIFLLICLNPQELRSTGPLVGLYLYGVMSIHLSLGTLGVGAVVLTGFICVWRYVRYGADRRKNILGIVGFWLGSAGVFMMLSKNVIFGVNKFIFFDPPSSSGGTFSQLITARPPIFGNPLESLWFSLRGYGTLNSAYQNRILFILIIAILLVLIGRLSFVGFSSGWMKSYELLKNCFPVILVAILVSVVHLVNSSDVGTVRRFIGGVFLGDAHRSAPLFEITVLLVGLILLDRLIVNKRVIQFVGFVVLALSLIVSVAAGSKFHHGFERYFGDWVGAETSKVLSTTELEGLRVLGSISPKGSRVLNYFGDGSPWMFAESGVVPTSIWGGMWVSSTDVWRLEDLLLLASEGDLADYDSSVYENLKMRLGRLSVCNVFVGSGNVNTSEKAWVSGFRESGHLSGFWTVDQDPELEWVILRPDDDLLPAQCALGRGD